MASTSFTVHTSLSPSEVLAADGTDLRVTLHREPSSFKGRLVAALIPLVGARILSKQFETVLRRAEHR